MTEVLRTKQEVWKETHARRTHCPICQKCVTLRTLRWRHACGRGSLPKRLLDAEMAELRRRELEELALAAFEVRQQEKHGGEAGGDDGADQGGVGGA